MAEGFVNVTEGSGKKLHTWDRTIGANAVHDEFTLPGEFVYPSYFARFEGVSIGTANDHVLAIWAGSSLNVRIRRIWIRQAAAAGAANLAVIQVLRTNTTPSGGTAVTMGKADSADATAGYSAATLPSTKGTETGVPLIVFAFDALATRPFADPIVWEQHPGMKPIIVPAGTTNGIALKISTAVATATVTGWVETVETAFV